VSKSYPLDPKEINHIFRGDNNEGSLADFHSESCVDNAALVFQGDNQAQEISGTQTVELQHVITPQGFLIHLKRNRIERLVLAKTSVLGEDKYLAFEDVFANQNFFKNLQVNQVIGVMSEAPKGVSFDEHLFEVDEWVCNFAFDRRRPSERRPILIFKFDSRYSAFDCIEQTRNIGMSDFHTPSDIEALKTHMRQLRIKLEGDDEMNCFDQLSNPHWTGVIGINLKVDVDNIPSDLRWLTPGINMDHIRWDFVGMSVGASYSPPEFPLTSAFGMLDYESPQGTKPAGSSESKYLPRKIQVVLRNSSLKEFIAKLEISPLEGMIRKGEAHTATDTISGFYQRLQCNDHTSHLYPFGGAEHHLQIQEFKKEFEERNKDKKSAKP
jgi:hypothetical protein